MSDELFPGFKTPPNDPSRDLRPAFTIEQHPEEEQSFDDEEGDEEPLCAACGGVGSFDCHCGGDLCVCDCNGERPCWECC